MSPKYAGPPKKVEEKIIGLELMVIVEIMAIRLTRNMEINGDSIEIDVLRKRMATN